MKKLTVLMTFLAVLCIAGIASAAAFDFSGNIANNNDVVFINFTLNQDSTNVRVWTDSFLGGGASGGNFDPITALWDANTGALIAQNDDNATINPATQTYFDSGFSLATLGAGSYRFSIACFNNFAAGSTLAQGFVYDGTAPIALGAWSGSDVSTPGLDPNIGTYWHVNLDGVDSASNTTPVPAPLILLGSGLLGVAGFRKKFKK